MPVLSIGVQINDKKSAIANDEITRLSVTSTDSPVVQLKELFIDLPHKFIACEKTRLRQHFRNKLDSGYSENG